MAVKKTSIYGTDLSKLISDYLYSKRNSLILARGRIERRILKEYKNTGAYISYDGKVHVHETTSNGEIKELEYSINKDDFKRLVECTELSNKYHDMFVNWVYPVKGEREEILKFILKELPTSHLVNMPKHNE